MGEDGTGSTDGTVTSAGDRSETSDDELDDTAEDEQEGYSDQDDEYALYEWLGMLSAGLGFFLTPLFTAPVAGYCAFRIRRWKPFTAALIVGLLAITTVFWTFVVLFVIP